MKNSIRTSLILSFFSTAAFDASAIWFWKTKETSNETVTAISPEGTETKDSDAASVRKKLKAGWRQIAIPPQGTARKGPDELLIAVPKGWSFEVGPDNRGVAIPPNGKSVKGMDGRLIAVPEGWIYITGPDGRAVAVPPEGTAAKGPDERMIAVPKGWTYETGPDCRLVAIPPKGRSFMGPDCRLVAVPEGWIYVNGPDCRAVAIPPEGTTVTGPDARTIAVPKGWISSKNNPTDFIQPDKDSVTNTNQLSTFSPTDLDLTDYATIYCILAVQTEEEEEEEDTE